MSRVVRPVRPKAVSWKSEGKVVMHHCKISVIVHVSPGDFLQRKPCPYLEARDFAVVDSEIPNVVS